MDFIKNFLEHLDAMGKLAGKATDYPVMLWKLEIGVTGTLNRI